MIAAPCADGQWAQALELLETVYVGEGYAHPDRVRQAYSRDVLEGAGTTLVATDGAGVLGVVILLSPASSLRQIALQDEAEFRLLAVDPQARGRGIGDMLVREVIRRAALPPCSASRLVLWTQPRMTAAQRLYERLGFRRAIERDALLAPYYAGPGGSLIERWVYTREL